MRRMRRLKSKQKSNLNHSQSLSDISTPTVTPYTMEATQFTKKVAPEPQDTNKNTEKQYQHLCPGERNTIAKMIKKGYCLAAIAKALGRGKQTICAEVNKNGGRDTYNPAEAQKKAEQRKLERDIKCKYAIKNRYIKPNENLIERLENLEMQFEILSETLKEVTRGRSKIDN